MVDSGQEETSIASPLSIRGASAPLARGNTGSCLQDRPNQFHGNLCGPRPTGTPAGVSTVFGTTARVLASRTRSPSDGRFGFGIFGDSWFWLGLVVARVLQLLWSLGAVLRLATTTATTWFAVHDLQSVLRRNNYGRHRGSGRHFKWLQRRHSNPEANAEEERLLLASPRGLSEKGDFGNATRLAGQQRDTRQSEELPTFIC